MNKRASCYLKDKNGKEIHIDDIMKYKNCIGIVEISNYISVFTTQHGNQIYLYHLKNKGEIIGNLHNNPELILGKYFYE